MAELIMMGRTIPSKRKRAVLSHESALTILRSELACAMRSPICRCEADLSEAPVLRMSEARGMRERFGLELPVHALALDEAHRRNSRSLRCHVLRARLAGRFFLEVEEGLVVCAPELVALQLASEMSMAELALLVSELCSGYALAPEIERGFRDRVSPVASLGDFNRLWAQSYHLRGRQKLARAVNLALPGARSPMETLLALFLSLPAEMGGCAMPKPRLNPQIKVLQGRGLNGGGGQDANRYGDLVWPDAKLVVEYDSKAEHDDVARDTSRANELMAAGWTVVTALPSDIMSISKFSRLAGDVAAIIGGPEREYPSDFSECQLSLRADLFTASGTRCRENRNWKPPEKL